MPITKGNKISLFSETFPALHQKMVQFVANCFILIDEDHRQPLFTFLATDKDIMATTQATLAKTHPDVQQEQELLSVAPPRFRYRRDRTTSLAQPCKG